MYDVELEEKVTEVDIKSTLHNAWLHHREVEQRLRFPAWLHVLRAGSGDDNISFRKRHLSTLLSMAGGVGSATEQQVADMGFGMEIQCSQPKHAAGINIQKRLDFIERLQSSIEGNQAPSKFDQEHTDTNPQRPVCVL